MTRVASDLLNDTFTLVQLARETALSRGQKDQAERLGPVADNLRSLVTASRQPMPQVKPAEATGVMAQPDFQALLRAVQAPGPSTASSPVERNQIAAAMATAGMGDLDIARHLGLTREEVRLILNVNNLNKK